MSNAKTKTKKLGLLLAVCLTASLLSASLAQAAEPVWSIRSLSNTTASPGGEQTFYLEVRNSGEAEAENAVEPIELHISLPANIEAVGFDNNFPSDWECPLVVGLHSFSCTLPENLPQRGVSGSWRLAKLHTAVGAPATGIETATFSVSGGGVPGASTVDPVRISSTTPPFGLDALDFATPAGPSGEPFTQAGGHPYAVTANFDFNTANDPGIFKGDAYPVEAARDVIVHAPPGFIANPDAFGHCTAAQLSQGTNSQAKSTCPTASQVGTVSLHLNEAIAYRVGPLPVFNMVPATGEPARFGFNALGVPVVIDSRLRSESDYGVDLISHRISQGLNVAGAEVTLWGLPSDHSHDPDRACPGKYAPWESAETCPGTDQPPFLRMPTRCTPGQGLPFTMDVDSWVHPGAEISVGRPELSDPAWVSATVQTHEGPGYPFNPQDPTTPWGKPLGTTSCEGVPVKGNLSARPTSLETETSSGLDVHVEDPNPGLELPEGISSSDVKDVKVALPQGMTINPSQASGLGVCSPSQYESTELSFNPDGAHGCPSDSKIGTVSVKSQLLEETLPGDVYVAKPYENPFNSLLALYIVIEEPERGILVKLPGELRLNEETGRIEAEFDDILQVPFESFDFHFREGARAPLVTPPTCGTYTTEATFTPWSDPAHTVSSTSDFQIVKGIGGGPCPPNGTPPFKPFFSAGAINNDAASFTPFDMHIQRADGEQEMTRFSATLPPGVLGRLAGVTKCPESAIAVAKAKTGLEEIAHPSCPAGSQIGHSLVGAGVGSVLTYVPGEVYLGGAFHGDPLSVIAITPVVAGPFDVGTVVVQEALTLNPKTAEVEVDGSASDPIPHMLKGIPAKLRDLRVYVDRPDFILNPTSCDPSKTDATLFGGGGDAFTSADDVPVALSDRFQAASCASLGFKPSLALSLQGGTRRGGHPALKATYKPRKGDANVKGLVVRLPRSAFLDQAHIKTICTRVQFAAGGGNGEQCPAASRYGFIKAYTPLLEEPLEGPVYLRSSNHKLPDLLFALHGLVDIEVDVRIDSAHGGIRASLEDSPDAPLSKVVLHMQGAKKGLIINSRNLCGSVNRADLRFEGHNGKSSSAKPEMRADCGGKGKSKRHR